MFYDMMKRSYYQPRISFPCFSSIKSNDYDVSVSVNIKQDYYADLSFLQITEGQTNDVDAVVIDKQRRLSLI